MKIWNDLNHYVEKYDGTFDLASLTIAGSPHQWLGEILMGLQTTSNSYRGDTNRRGETYSNQSAAFETMDFNGGAIIYNHDTPSTTTSKCLYVSDPAITCIRRYFHVLAMPNLGSDQSFTQ